MAYDVEYRMTYERDDGRVETLYLASGDTVVHTNPTDQPQDIVFGTWTVPPGCSVTVYFGKPRQPSWLKVHWVRARWQVRKRFRQLFLELLGG